jgi:coat protein Gp5
VANQFINTSWVCLEILRILINELECAEYFNRDYEKEFNKEFAPGSNVTIKFPWRPTVTQGMGYDPQGIARISTTISLDEWLQIAFEWDDYEKAVKLERSEKELRENYWQPCAKAFAQEIDSICADFASTNASNVVGSLGTDPTSVSTYYGARKILKQQACPPGKRCMLISSSMMASLGANITSIFHPDDEITQMFKEGAIGRLAGFSFFESQSLYEQTAGTWASTVTVTGANQSGTALIITGTNGDTINARDKFSVANVNAVNPQTRRSAGPLTPKSFTVVQNYTLDGNPDTISILPPIYGPGSPYQNVDALPSNGAALTLWPGTASPNGKTGTIGLALSRFAFGLVGGKLYLPKAVEDSGQQMDPDSGIALRKVEAWDPVRSVNVKRMDSLLGTGNLYQDNGACVVAGA